MSQKCTVAVQDTVNGGKAHIVDSSKIRIIFNDSLLYLFQFNGLVFEDHVNDELFLLCGEQKTPSAPIRALCRSTKKIMIVVVTKIQNSVSIYSQFETGPTKTKPLPVLFSECPQYGSHREPAESGLFPLSCFLP